MHRAIVTGNSDGIGLAFSRLLLERGWTVAGVSRSPSVIRHASYSHTIADVRSLEYGDSLEALGRAGRLDLFVYCPGFGEEIDGATLSREREVFEVNLLGLVESLRIIVPILVSARRGHIIGLSSLGDRLHNSHWPSYAASKAAMSSYLESLALSLRPHGVSVTNVRLGFVDTKMAKSAVRPFMMSTERAARLLWRCVRRRPIRLSVPKRMALLLWLVALKTRLRIWLS